MWCIAVIAWNTFRENLRDKILYTVLFFAVLLISASVLLGSLTILELLKLSDVEGLFGLVQMPISPKTKKDPDRRFRQSEPSKRPLGCDCIV